MSDDTNKTIATMMEKVDEHQKGACLSLGDILSRAGDHMDSNALEILAQSLATMANARRQLENMAVAVFKMLDEEKKEFESNVNDAAQ